MKKAVFILALLLNPSFLFAQKNDHLPNDRLFNDRGEKIQKVFGDAAAQFHYDHRMNPEFVDAIKDMFYFDVPTLKDVKDVLTLYVEIHESVAAFNQKHPQQPTNDVQLSEIYIQRVLKGRELKGSTSHVMNPKGLKNENTKKRQVEALLTFMELLARDSQYAGAAFGIQERQPRAFEFFERLRKEMNLVAFDASICPKVLDDVSCDAQVKPSKRVYVGPRAQY